jgi:hypothetical protein
VKIIVHPRSTPFSTSSPHLRSRLLKMPQNPSDWGRLAFMQGPKMTKVLHSIATGTHAAAKKASDRELLNDMQEEVGVTRQRSRYLVRSSVKRGLNARRSCM